MFKVVTSSVVMAVVDLKLALVYRPSDALTLRDGALYWRGSPRSTWCTLRLTRERVVCSDWTQLAGVVSSTELTSGTVHCTRKVGNISFLNNAFNIFLFIVIQREMFYLMMHSTHFIYGYMASDMVKDHSDSEKGNPLPPHRLLFLINSKGSFICTIPQTG